MTRQAAEEAKKEKTSADHTRIPRSSREEIEADVDAFVRKSGKSRGKAAGVQNTADESSEKRDARMPWAIPMRICGK